MNYNQKQLNLYTRLNASGLKAPSRLEKLAFTSGWDSVSDMLRPLALALIAIPFITLFIILIMVVL